MLFPGYFNWFPPTPDGVPSEELLHSLNMWNRIPMTEWDAEEWDGWGKPSGCAELCTRDPFCVGFAFNVPDGSAYDSGCWLYNGTMLDGEWVSPSTGSPVVSYLSRRALALTVTFSVRRCRKPVNFVDNALAVNVLAVNSVS